MWCLFSFRLKGQLYWVFGILWSIDPGPDVGVEKQVFICRLALRWQRLVKQTSHWLCCDLEESSPQHAVSNVTGKYHKG